MYDLISISHPFRTVEEFQQLVGKHLSELMHRLAGKYPRLLASCGVKRMLLAVSVAWGLSGCAKAGNVDAFAHIDDALQPPVAWGCVKAPPGGCVMVEGEPFFISEGEQGMLRFLWDGFAIFIDHEGCERVRQEFFDLADLRQSKAYDVMGECLEERLPSEESDLSQGHRIPKPNNQEYHQEIHQEIQQETKQENKEEIQLEYQQNNNQEYQQNNNQEYQQNNNQEYQQEIQLEHQTCNQSLEPAVRENYEEPHGSQLQAIQSTAKNCSADNPFRENISQERISQENYSNDTPFTANCKQTNCKQENSLQTNCKQANSLQANCKQENSLQPNCKQANSLQANCKQENSLQVNCKQANPLTFKEMMLCQIAYVCDIDLVRPEQVETLKDQLEYLLDSPLAESLSADDILQISKKIRGIKPCRLDRMKAREAAAEQRRIEAEQRRMEAEQRRMEAEQRRMEAEHQLLAMKAAISAGVGVTNNFNGPIGQWIASVGRVSSEIPKEANSIQSCSSPPSSGDGC